MDGRKILRGLAAGVGGVVAVVVLITVGLVLWLNSAAGRKEIERYASDALGQAGLTLSVEDFEGVLPFRVSVRDIEIRQDDSVVLAAEKVHLRWQPFFLLAGRIHIETVLAEAIRLERMPVPTVAGSEAEDRDLVRMLGWLKRLAVKRLDISRLEVGEAIAGERGAWRIHGRVGISDGDMDRTRLDIARIDDRSDRFVADIGYRRDEQSLQLDMSWHEAPGGAIAEWIGLPADAAIDVDVTGDGRTDGWQGRIFGRFGDGTTELSVRTEGRDETRLRVSGDVDVRTLVPRRYAALAAGRLDLDASARQRKRYRVIKVAQFSYANESLDLRAAGHLDRKKGEFKAEAELLQKTPDGMAELLAPVKTEDLTASVSLLGTVESPVLTIAARAGQFAVGGVEAADMHLRGDLAAANGTRDQKYRFAAKVETFGLGWDLEGMDRLVRGPATADLQGIIDGKILLAVENVEVRLPDATVTGPVELNLRERTLRAPLKVTVNDLDSLDPLARVDLEGSASLDVDVYMPDFDGDVRIDTAGKVRDFSIGVPVVRSAVSPEMELTARLATAPGTGLKVSDIRIEGERSSIFGAVSFPSDYSRIEISAQCRLPDASVISPEIGIDVQGFGSATAELTGPIDDPSVAGTIRLGGVTLPVGPWNSVTGNFSLDHLVSGAQGSVVLSGDGPPGATRVDSEILIGEQKLEIRGIRARAPGIQAQGRIEIPFTGSPLSGRFEASIEDLGPLVQAYASGESSGRIDATLELSEVEGAQAIRLTSIGEGLGFRAGPSRPLRAERLEMEMTLTGLDENAVIDGVIVASQFTGPSSRLPTAQVGVSGTLIAPVVDLETAGTVLRSETDLAASLSMDFRDSVSRFRLTRLSGSLGEMTIESRKAASLTISGKEIHLDDVDVALGGGFVTGQASLGTPDAALNLSVNALPLALFRLVNPDLDLTGQLDTRIDLRTQNGGTAGAVDLRVTSVQLPNRRRSTPLSGALQGELLSGRLMFTVTAEASLGEPITARGEIPLDVNLEAVRADLRRDGALNGRLEWSGEAYNLMSLLPLEDHLVRGPMSVMLSMAGSPSNPRISGQLILRDGRYEHLLAGTVLTPLDLHIEGDGEGLRLVRLGAGDGNGGTLSGEGRLSLDTESGFPIDAGLDFQGLTLLRRDEITGRATGQLRATGTLKDLAITGLITTEQFDVQLINNLPPQVVELEVTEIDDEFDAVNGPGVSGRDRKRLVNGDLDIRVELPDRIFVRGLGLDSEWEGSLDVQGSIAQPKIVGRLESRRGVLMFLGRRFRIEPSNLQFAGGRKVDPILDVRAVYQGPQLEVTVNLTGPISNPGLALSSDPPLPEDEILSRALFNKSTGELSAVEAVQLAAAVGELTVTGGGPGALARLREAVGVDVLRVGTTETTEGEQATTVEAGTYLADGLYLGVETSTFEESGAVTVEYEVTRRIRLTTDLKQTGGKNIGIEYKRDY